MLLDTPATRPSLDLTPAIEPVVTLTTVQSPTPPTPTRKPGVSPRVWLAVAGAVLVAWAYFPTLDWLVSKWSADPSYSHGFLVPFVAGFMVWYRRKDVTEWFSAPQPMVAGGVLLVALGLRMLGGGLLVYQIDCLALLLSVAAVVLAAGGWRLVKNCWRGLVFLVFMVPLLYEMEQNLGVPLKVVATYGSLFLLQAFGLPAVLPGGYGFVIHIEDVQLGVADACNGFKMLLTFAAIGGAALLLLKRSWFERLMIALGVVPIAVASNVIRITVTGVIYYLWVRDPKVQHAVHDALGYVMAVLGIALLMLELWVLNRLIVKPQQSA